MVHDDDVARRQGWNENLFDIGLECDAVHRAVEDHGRTITTTKYVDGFGRVYKERLDGDSSSLTTDTDTVFDDRGNIYKLSLPYETGTTASFTASYYDWDNRLVKVANPDGTTRSQVWAISADYAYPEGETVWTSNRRVLKMLLTDELGRRVETTYNSDGQVVLVRRTNDDGNFKVIYGAKYDVLKRLLNVKDPGEARKRCLDPTFRISA